MRLQDELSGTENRISVARKRYNDALQDYNTFILQFPNSIWAGIAGFHQNNAYFTASPAAQAVPNGEFLNSRLSAHCRRARKKAIPRARDGLSGLRSFAVNGLLEGSDGAGLVVVDVEDGVQLGQLQQVVDLLGQFEQFERRRPDSWPWCRRSPVRPGPSYRCSSLRPDRAGCCAVLCRSGREWRRATARCPRPV